MNKKSLYFIYSVVGLFVVFVSQIVYLNSYKSITNTMLDKKSAFVKIVGLPDIAISTEATYIRHRSLSDMFSIYKDDGALREYFPSTFIYSPSRNINAKK
jgi:hypothetical protein